MRKKILITLIVIAAIVGVFAVVVALQPSEYHVERSAAMAAPAPAVFEQVNDFQKWKAWSPWEKLDPNVKYSYEGPTAGKGAIVKWSGNSDVGEGSMTITESRPSDLIRIKLDFIKPMEGTSDVELAFKPDKADASKTAVTWSMSGRNNFIGKAICMFMDMDRMIGGNMDEGLAAIKSIVEPKK